MLGRCLVFTEYICVYVYIFGITIKFWANERTLVLLSFLSENIKCDQDQTVGQERGMIVTGLNVQSYGCC